MCYTLHGSYTENEKQGVVCMSKIVARMQKMKAGNLTGIGNHNQRKTKNHSNKDIDPSLSHLNYDLVNRTKNYQTDIQTFINETKSTKRAVRKDAVLVNEWIITSDNDFFDHLTNGERENFFKRSKEYFTDKFGEENIRYATVHLDETTPHMHLGVVPFDKENKLSAKRVFGRQTLREVQEDLPRELQKVRFDIERGEKGSKRKNLTVPEFKAMKTEEKEIKKEVREIEENLELKRNELASYDIERTITTAIDSLKGKKETEEVKVASGEKFLGIDIKETVTKDTGNYIISGKDLKNIHKLNKLTKKTQVELSNLLSTDVYTENKELKNELKIEIKEHNKDIDDYNDLARSYNKVNDENTSLKSQIRDLKREVKLIYKTTKDFLKERTKDIKTFKDIFKDLVADISIDSKNNSLKSHFEKEYKKENRSRGRSR